MANAISNWASVSSGDEIYGLIDADYAQTGHFSDADTYQITITETDSQSGTSQPVTQALSTSYFTIDFQAGGKEIAFGAPANDVLTNYPNGLFKCEMDMTLRGYRVPTIFISTADPTSNDGENGDIWLKYS